MKLSKFKKIAKFGLIGAIPFVTVIPAVSCGSNKDDPNSLTIAIRAEDVAMWTPLKDQFEKATGVKVAFRYTDNQVNDYRMWNSSNTLPDICIADNNAAKTGVEENFFQPLDLKDIATNENYKITGVDAKYEEKNLTFSDTDFNMNMLNTNKDSSTDKYRAYSVIWGPKILYAWSKLGSKNLISDNAATAKPLEWFVPKADGSGLEKVDKFDDGDGQQGDTLEDAKVSPLFSIKDGHRLKTTQSDIQEFINNTIFMSQISFNKGLNEAAITDTHPENRVIATGSLGQVQRLASIGETIFEQASFTSQDKVQAAMTMDQGPMFDSILQGKAGVTGNATDTNYDDATKSALDDSKWINTSKADAKNPSVAWNGKPGAINSLSDIMAREYLGNFGYFSGNAIKTSVLIGVSDAQTAFAKGQVLFLPGAKWQSGAIDTAVSAGTGLDKKDITAFSLPIQTAGVDGYAFSKKLSGEKLINAQKFLRFIMQAQAAADISGDKAVSTVIKGAEIQAKNSSTDDKISAAVTGSTVADINGQTKLDIPFTYSKQSTNNIYDMYNDHFIKDQNDYYKDGKMSLQDFKDRIKDMNKALDTNLSGL